MRNTFGIYKTIYSLPEEYHLPKPDELLETYIERILLGWSEQAGVNFTAVFGFQPNCFVCSKEIFRYLENSIRQYWVIEKNKQTLWKGVEVHFVEKNVLFWYCNKDNTFEIDDLMDDFDVDMIKQAQRMYTGECGNE